MTKKQSPPVNLDSPFPSAMHMAALYSCLTPSCATGASSASPLPDLVRSFSTEGLPQPGDHLPVSFPLGLCLREGNSISLPLRKLPKQQAHDSVYLSACLSMYASIYPLFSVIYYLSIIYYLPSIVSVHLYLLSEEGHVPIGHLSQ